MNYTYADEKTEYYVYILVGVAPIACLCLIGLIIRSCQINIQEVDI